MILHIVEDEKFINYVVKQFERYAPNKNVYLMIKYENNQNLVHTSEHQNLIFDTYESKSYQNILKKINSFKAVIFHNLIPNYKLKVLSQINSDVKKVLFSWGSDIYNRFFEDKLYLPKNREFLNKNFTFKNKLNFRSNFYAHLWEMKNKREHPFLNLKRLYNKFDYCSTVIPQDYVLLKKILNLKSEFLNFSYGDIDSLNAVYNKSKGTDLLLGNSAATTNNHIDALYLLKDCFWKNKIFVPLSYPRHKINYINKVKEIGRKLFNSKFVPLDEFLPLNDYKNILDNVTITFMPQLRQQGLGNIIQQIARGNCLFFYEENPVCEFFYDLGLKFKLINKLGNEIKNDLNDNDLLHNYQIVNKYYSGSETDSRMKTIIKTLN